MMRQPDGYILAYRDGALLPIPVKSFERMVRSSAVAGFWRVWVKAERGGA